MQTMPFLKDATRMVGEYRTIRMRRIRGGDVETFQDDYRWCSNFWHAPVLLDGVEYPTVEHAYQAAKTDSPLERHQILNAPTANKAKGLGAYVTKRPDFGQEKIAIMHDLVLQKFSRHPELQQALLLTQDAAIVEGNFHQDCFWGQYNGIGANHLGVIMMQVRSTLRQQLKNSTSPQRNTTLSQ